MRLSTDLRKIPRRKETSGKQLKKDVFSRKFQWGIIMSKIQGITKICTDAVKAIQRTWFK